MFSDFWHFIGYFLILALLLEAIKKIICNINAKFIEELKKYGKKRATE